MSRSPVASARRLLGSRPPLMKMRETILSTAVFGTTRCAQVAETHHKILTIHHGVCHSLHVEGKCLLLEGCHDVKIRAARTAALRPYVDLLMTCKSIYVTFSPRHVVCLERARIGSRRRYFQDRCCTLHRPLDLLVAPPSEALYE